MSDVDLHDEVAALRAELDEARAERLADEFSDESAALVEEIERRLEAERIGFVAEPHRGEEPDVSADFAEWLAQAKEDQWSADAPTQDGRL
jgi:hypothetical protein